MWWICQNVVKLKCDLNHWKTALLTEIKTREMEISTSREQDTKGIATKRPKEMTRRQNITAWKQRGEKRRRQNITGNIVDATFRSLLDI